ncbi:GNAT family N-acetyltransferase [Sphingomonas endolithica]|uniref:GNAT family N-acetyltransferase n=1 Tax=Sphingomonas endolithica TaxID=2972485 RepID=UPI0021AFF0EA|nr:GNAT family N-acetyltransferase [Sphingomonas sp. ZFBP2030]
MLHECFAQQGHHRDRSRRAGYGMGDNAAAACQLGWRRAGETIDMSYRIRRFRPADRDAMLAFAESLPEHDLLFLGRDLRHPRVIDAWQVAIEEGWIDSLVAEDDGEFVGTAALVRDPLGWSAHVGEIRLLVAPTKRGAGLGRDLLEAILAVAPERGVEKLTAQMTPDQIGSVMLFESLGFRAEALLKNHVRDRDGKPHDLAILAQDVVSLVGTRASDL